MFAILSGLLCFFSKNFLKSCIIMCQHFHTANTKHCRKFSVTSFNIKILYDKTCNFFNARFVIKQLLGINRFDFYVAVYQSFLNKFSNIVNLKTEYIVVSNRIHNDILMQTVMEKIICCQL